jgi:hypothetical protein
MYTPPAGNAERLEEVRVVEVSLLLTAWQFARLAEAATRRGLTIGQMVRQITRESLGVRPSNHTEAGGPPNHCGIEGG